MITGNPQRHTRKQQGAVLVLSLALLLAMTVLALSLSQSVRSQSQISRNIREKDVAFELAESGLRAGESSLIQMSSTPAGCSAPPCMVYAAATLPERPQDQNMTWWSNLGKEYSTEGAAKAASTRYVVEEVAFIPDSLTIGIGKRSGRFIYRITAVGSEKADGTSSVLQSTYARRF